MINASLRYTREYKGHRKSLFLGEGGEIPLEAVLVNALREESDNSKESPGVRVRAEIL